MLMSFNVASLPVALSGMVKSFNVPPTTVATGIVMYSMAAAAGGGPVAGDTVAEFIKVRF